MESVGQKIIRLRAERQIKAATLARLAGISRQTLFSIEHRGSDIPDSSTLAKLAPALGMPVAELVADTTAQYQGEMMSGPIQASHGEQAGMDRFFILIHPHGDTEPSGWMTQYVPVRRQRLKEWMGPIETEEPVPMAVPRLGHYLAVRIVGDSMEPECSPGDLAVIDCDEYPRLGDVVLAVVAGEEILRYLVERTATRIVLVAENTTVADISLSVAEVEIVGVVLTFVRLPKPRRRATERVG